MAPAMERKQKIDRITKLLYEYCVVPDKERIQTTGTILPTSSLRHQATRHALRFASSLKDIHGRFFTKALTRDCLNQLCTHYKLELPSTPGFTVAAWVEQESEVLHKLLKRARQSTAKPDPSELPPSDDDHEAMDNMETQVWDGVPVVDLDPTEDLQMSMFCVQGFAKSFFLGIFGLSAGDRGFLQAPSLCLNRQTRHMLEVCVCVCLTYLELACRTPKWR